MEYDDKTYLLIEQYLLGQLKGKELADFENRMANDTTFNQEVRMNRSLFNHFDEGVEIHSRNEELEAFYQSDDARRFKAQLNESYTQYKNEADTDKPIAKVRKLGWKPLAVAASILLLVGFFLFNPFGGPAGSDELLAAYVEHEPLALVTKGNTEDAIVDIETAFNNKDYTQSITLIDAVLESLDEQSPYWFDLNLSKGIAEWETDNTQAAKTIFDTLRKSDFQDAPKADWYYILTLLKEDDRANAKEEIQTYLSNGGTYKSKEMRAILKEL